MRSAVAVAVGRAQQVCLAPDEVGVRVVRRVIAQPAIIAVRVVRAVRIVGLNRACRWRHPEHLSLHDRVQPAGRDHGQPAHAVSERQGRAEGPCSSVIVWLWCKITIDTEDAADSINPKSNIFWLGLAK